MHAISLQVVALTPFLQFDTTPWPQWALSHLAACFAQCISESIMVVAAGRGADAVSAVRHRLLAAVGALSPRSLAAAGRHCGVRRGAAAGAATASPDQFCRQVCIHFDELSSFSTCCRVLLFCNMSLTYTAMHRTEMERHVLCMLCRWRPGATCARYNSGAAFILTCSECAASGGPRVSGPQCTDRLAFPRVPRCGLLRLRSQACMTVGVVVEYKATTAGHSRHHGACGSGRSWGFATASSVAQSCIIRKVCACCCAGDKVAIVCAPSDKWFPLTQWQELRRRLPGVQVFSYRKTRTPDMPPSNANLPVCGYRACLCGCCCMGQFSWLDNVDSTITALMSIQLSGIAGRHGGAAAAWLLRLRAAVTATCGDRAAPHRRVIG